MPFDEGRLWKGSDGLALREELRTAFVNITRIMDCVGCEKCKLWGKLQTLGAERRGGAVAAGVCGGAARWKRKQSRAQQGHRLQLALHPAALSFFVAR